MPPDDDLASHFETVLDREEGRAPPPKAARREREEETEPLDRDELFPQRETEGDPPDEDDEAPQQQEVDAEEEDADDPRRQPETGEPEEEDQETALDLNQIVRVNVDGEPAEVSLQEALNGYVRAETFHRRLNQLGQVAQQIERERGELAQGREYYAQMIPALHQQLLSLQPQEPDWDKLYAEDAQEAARLERQWRTYREKLGQLQNEHKRVQHEQEQERLRQEAIYEDTQRQQLVRLVPEWTDPKRWERDRKAMIRTAMAVGYSEKELEGLKDARATIVLRKAALYDLLMANKPRPVRQQGALRPGAISSRAAPNGLARAEKRLQRTGSVRDAARAFEADLDREG
jgi:hypothetical protein